MPWASAPWLTWPSSSLPRSPQCHLLPSIPVLHHFIIRSRLSLLVLPPLFCSEHVSSLSATLGFPAPWPSDCFPVPSRSVIRFSQKSFPSLVFVFLSSVLGWLFSFVFLPVHKALFGFRPVCMWSLSPQEQQLSACEVIYSSVTRLLACFSLQTYTSVSLLNASFRRLAVKLN